MEQTTSLLAHQLADGPATGLAVTKKQINEETLFGLKEALEAEATVQARCMLHPDFREGYAAFTEKRKPSFQKRRDFME